MHVAFDRFHLRVVSMVSVATLLFLVASPSMAAQINYGTHAGAHFNYVNVTEDSGADEPLPLYGPPIVTGDSIDFQPLGFDAASANGGSDITSSNLVFDISAKLGSRVQSVTLSESGDTTLAGNVTPGSMGTSSAIFAAGVLDVTEVDFAPINHISVPFSFTFSPSGGTYFLGTDGGGGPTFHTEWTGSVTLPIDQILIANGYDLNVVHGATRVSLDLNNMLTAVSEPGTSSLIQKKDFGGITIRTEVENDIPEPIALSLAGLGMLAIVRGRNRMTR